MSPVLLRNSHLPWIYCVTGVFEECILFILSEINPWILICFIGKQFRYSRKCKCKCLRERKLKPIDEYESIWKKKRFSDTKSDSGYKWSSRTRSESCISLNVTLVTTQYSKFMGSYCAIDTICTGKCKLTVAVHLCAFIPANPFFLIIYQNGDF